MSKKQNKQTLKMWRSCRVFLKIILFQFCDDYLLSIFLFDFSTTNVFFFFVLNYVITSAFFFFLFLMTNTFSFLNVISDKKKSFYFSFSLLILCWPALFFLFQFCDWVKVISIYYIYHPQTRWFKFHPPRRNWSFPRFKVAFKRGQAQEGDLI